MDMSNEAKEIIEEYIEDIEGNYFDEITRAALTKYGPSVFEEVVEVLNEVEVKVDRIQCTQKYFIENGVVYTADKRVLLKYDINKADKEFIIPSTVEYVAAEAFKGNASLETVLVPQSVKRFNSKAYEGCSKLVVCFGKTIFRI